MIIPRYLLIISLASCLCLPLLVANIRRVDNPTFNPNTPGPFDSKGNYVTSWADGKWKRYYKPSKTTSKPTIVITPDPPKPKPQPVVTHTGNFRTHTVVRGDTLYGISKKYGVTINDLKSINAIENAHLIRIGMVLKVPIK